MNPQEEKRTYCVYGYWHIASANQYVMKDGKIELHLYDNIDEAIAFIKKHSPWNVNITWSLTWDEYEIERLRKVRPLEKQECDLIEYARWEGYNQAFKDITERMRKMHKTSPEETQKLLMEHFYDMIE